MDLEWAAADTTSLAKVTKAKASALLFFADEKNPKPARTDVGDLAKKGLIYGVTVTKPKAKEVAKEAVGEAADDGSDEAVKEAGKEAGKEAAKEVKKEEVKTIASPLPTSPFASTDLWATYGVTSGGVYILTDKYGNEVGRAETPKVRAFALAAAKVLKARRKSVVAKTKTARKALSAKDYAKAYAELQLAFEHKLVGYTESNSAARLYKAWLKAARAAIASAKTDQALLAPLRTSLKGTPLESELPTTKVVAAAKPVAKPAAKPVAKEAEVGSEKHGN